jgi:RimJ/RimL family protein N-acetyltransferase
MGGVLLHPYRLADGTQVVLRPVRAADKRLLREAFARLSPESARMRFLGPKARLTTSELRYLTEVDGLDHVAVVAVLAHAPTHVVAVGRFVRLPEDPQTAEVAIVVGDPWQRQGVGRHVGLERGVRRFVATMLSDNVASHRLFAAISDRLSTRHDGAIDELCAELAA